MDAGQNRRDTLVECVKGLIRFEDRFELVGSRDAGWICERLAWHKLLPLAAALHDPSRPKCPELESVFERTSLHNAVLEAHYAKQATSIFRALSDASISFLPYKGPFWSQQIYPEYSWKHIGDIDLLLTKEDARRAATVLQALGYTPQRRLEDDAFSSKYEFSLVPGPATKSGIPVELHWEAFPGPRLVRKRFLRREDLTDNTSRAQWKGLTYRLPSREVQVYYYLLHGVCQHQCMRFVHVLTVAQYINRFSDIDWDTVARLMIQRSSSTPVYFGLKYVNAFSPLPEAPLRLMKETNPSWKARIAAAPLTPRSIPFSSRRRGRFRRKLFRMAMTW